MIIDNKSTGKREREGERGETHSAFQDITGKYVIEYHALHWIKTVVERETETAKEKRRRRRRRRRRRKRD